MKLGLRLELYRAADLAVPMPQILRAEELGFHSVWTAEAYGSDALSPLAYVAALTTRIKLGTSVVQLAARPPATLAMHAMTIDALAGGGRVIIGIGVSGPQIVEGWYGQPWGSPNARLRDYVDHRRQGAPAGGAGHPRRSRDLPSVSRRRRPRSGQGAEVDHAPERRRFRSGWHREGRGTPSCAPSCATGGCRWVSVPVGWRATARNLDRGFARRLGRPAASRSSPVAA